MGLRIKIALLAFLIVISFTAISDAAWEGPVEVISGTWGSGNGQFGINYGDTADQFPNMIVISTTGRMLIGDSINKRIQVFNSDGAFSNLITPKNLPASYAAILQWPLNLFICGDANIYTSVSEHAQIYSISGELQNFTTITAGIVFIDQRQCNFYTHNPSTKTFSLYSPTGALIRTTTDRPLELGKVKEKKTAAGYTYTVQYPDITNPNTVKTYTINLPGLYERFVRDNTGNINAIAGKAVRKFDGEGREIGAMRTLANEIRTIRPAGGGFEAETEVISEYGSPVIAPNGDVYTWKRTPTAYSIIKWRWQ